MAHLFQIIPRSFGLHFLSLRALLCLCFFPAVLAASSPPATEPHRAELKISGYGILGNRELKRILRTLELSGKTPEYFDSSFVEDAALILASRIRRDGYLRPKILLVLDLADDGHMRLDAEDLLENPLPRSLRISRVEFKIQKGLLYYYQQLTFEGLTVLKEKNARSYFVETGTLIQLKRTEIYTPENLRRGLASLTDVLDRRGYEQAKVEAARVSQDDKTGAVQVHVRVVEGPRFIVHSVREEITYENGAAPTETRIVFPNKPHSRIWVQDFTLSLKTNQYHRGYPDTSIDITTLEQKAQTNQIQMDLLARINTGPQVRIGDVQFKGQKLTKESIMSRRVRVKRGDLLDPVQVEEGRYRLAQLGAFDSVNVN